MKETESIFKSADSDKISIKSHHTKSSKSTLSQSSSKNTSRCSNQSSANRQGAAPEVATNEATLEVLLEQERHIEELERLEAEAAQLRVKQEAENAERKRVLEAKRRRLETIKKIKAAKAWQQVNERSECSDEEIDKLLHQRGSLKEKQEVKHESTVQHISPPQTVIQLKQEDNTAALVRVFAESISASRLPIPEPTTFNGDPLRFNDWKELIDRKNIPAEEKIYYL